MLMGEWYLLLDEVGLSNFRKSEFRKEDEFGGRKRGWTIFDF